jgi:hypothetical protein
VESLTVEAVRDRHECAATRLPEAVQKYSGPFGIKDLDLSATAYVAWPLTECAQRGRHAEVRRTQNYFGIK